VRSRVGELWEEWHSGGWQLLLVLSTKRLSFGARLHTCLNLDVGSTSENIETLENIWENTPSENVYGPNNWFSYSMRRRKVSP
jgi:hypothetical protein